MPPAYRTLPLGAVLPTGMCHHDLHVSILQKVSAGWLKEQLAIQANGLSGHLPFFWPDVMNSSWLGGSGDTGLHERTPYWLNGFVPLAYQLQDPLLMETVRIANTAPANSFLHLITGPTFY